MTERVAIFIDADNVSANFAQIILSEAGNLGTIVSKQFFGDPETPMVSRWLEVNVQLDFNLTHIQVVRDNGKDSTDMALASYVVRSACKNEADIYVIVSNDKDFVPVVEVLKEEHKRVCAMVTGLPSVRLMQACHNFYFLDKIKEYDDSRSEQLIKLAEANKPDYVRVLDEIIDTQNDGSGWYPLGAAASDMRERMPMFNTRDYGSKKFSEFIQSSDYFKLGKSSNGGLYVCKQRTRAA